MPSLRMRPCELLHSADVFAGDGVPQASRRPSAENSEGDREDKGREREGEMKRYCLSGEWAVVTGACSGIGLEFSHRLAELGASVVMVSNRERELQEAARDVASRHDVNTLPLTLDLTSERAAEEIMSFIDRNGVDPSVFINNAGIFSFAPVTGTGRGRIAFCKERRRPHPQHVVDVMLDAYAGAGHVRSHESLYPRILAGSPLRDA